VPVPAIAIGRDLGGVNYVSSRGLLALDAAAGRTYAAGGSFALCDPSSEPVRLALAMAGLTSYVPVEATREAGLNRLRQASAPADAGDDDRPAAP